MHKKLFKWVIYLMIGALVFSSLAAFVSALIFGSGN